MKPVMAAPVVPKEPTGKPTAADAGVHVANVKAKAAKMRGQGLMSQAAHDKLMAKANKVAAAFKTPKTPKAAPAAPAGGDMFDEDPTT